MPLIFTTKAGKQNQHGRLETIEALPPRLGAVRPHSPPPVRRTAPYILPLYSIVIVIVNSIQCIYLFYKLKLVIYL
jgi:hypothetical protein